MASCVMVESLESRSLLSVGISTGGFAAELASPPAVRVTRVAANPLAAVKGTYVGTITDATYGVMDARLVISKVDGKRIVGKMWVGSRTGVGVQPFTFDCSNSTCTVTVGKVATFRLSVPGPAGKVWPEGEDGKLVLKGNVRSTMLAKGTTTVVPRRMTGSFKAYWIGEKRYFGSFDVTRL